MFQKISAFVLGFFSAFALLFIGGFLSKDNPLIRFNDRVAGRYLLLVHVRDHKIITEEVHINRLADGDYRQEKENLNEEIRFLKKKLSPHEFEALLEEKSIESLRRFVDKYGLSPDQRKQLAADPFYKDHLAVISRLYKDQVDQFDSSLLLPAGPKDPLPKLW